MLALTDAAISVSLNSSTGEIALVSVPLTAGSWNYETFANCLSIWLSLTMLAQRPMSILRSTGKFAAITVNVLDGGSLAEPVLLPTEKPPTLFDQNNFHIQPLGQFSNTIKSKLKAPKARYPQMEWFLHFAGSLSQTNPSKTLTCLLLQPVIIEQNEIINQANHGRRDWKQRNIRGGRVYSGEYSGWIVTTRAPVSISLPPRTSTWQSPPVSVSFPSRTSTKQTPPFDQTKIKSWVTRLVQKSVFSTLIGIGGYFACLLQSMYIGWCTL